MSKTPWGDFPEATLTAEIYRAAQPPEIRALMNMPREIGGARDKKGFELAQQGFVIDVPIMVWGWEPVTTMLMRKNLGFVWVPSGLQPNIPNAFGTTPPIPAGAIKVSVDAADYPPFDVPEPPKPPAGVVGVSLGVGTWDFAHLDKTQEAFVVNNFARFPEGYIFEDGGVKYTFHLLGSPLMDPHHRQAVWLKAA